MFSLSTIPNYHSKLENLRRPKSAQTVERIQEKSARHEVDAILAELKDRFGQPPLPVIWLIHMTRIRVRASANHFTLIKFDRLTFTLEKTLGKTSEKKSFALPITKDPQVIEDTVAKIIG